MYGALLILVAAACPTAPQDPPPDVTVVHFNDFHGQIRPRQVVRHPGKPPVATGGFATLAHYVRQRRAELGERLWVTNGGDWFQGTPEGNEDRGASVLAAIEWLRPTASVLGNHEYDFGERHLFALVEGAQHPVLGANVLERGTDRLRPYVRPYVIKTVQLTRGPPGAVARVALVGLVTSDTPNVSTGPFGSADYQNEEKTLEALWPALRRDADVIVLLTHCGVERDRDLARRFPDIALILGGHSHTALRRPVVVGKTWIVQSGSRGAALTEVGLRLSMDPPAAVPCAFRFVDLDVETVGVDAEAEVMLRRRFAHVADKWDRAIGEVRGATDSRRGPGSTPAGNLVAALIRQAGEADVGLMNKGGLRSALALGAITRRGVFELVPFDNTVVTFELTGAQLRELLRQGLRRGRRPLEIDGGRYGYAIVDGHRELRGIEVAGMPLADDRAYRVATNSFLAAGGDGFEVFSQSKRVHEVPTLLRGLLLARLAETGELVLEADERIRFVED